MPSYRNDYFKNAYDNVSENIRWVLFFYIAINALNIVSLVVTLIKNRLMQRIIQVNNIL